MLWPAGDLDAPEEWAAFKVLNAVTSGVGGDQSLPQRARVAAGADLDLLGALQA